MKRIKIPEKIKLGESSDGPIYMTFADWMINNPLNGKSFGADGKTLRQAIRIEDKVKKAQEEDLDLVLDDADYDLLLRESESPEGGFNTPIAKRFLAYMDAVKDAKDE